MNMKEATTIRFSTASVKYHFDARFKDLSSLVDRDRAVLVTDEHVHAAHARLFKGWNTIVLKAGEEYKIQPTVDGIIGQLIAMQADRQFTLVGVGGGVVTDLTGYAASVYMRGIAFGFVPTSLLAMVDASIGGKNGIDVGPYKNLVGTIRQPSFLLYDYKLLDTLPEAEWSNGFAEVIKHACIGDASAFRLLEGTDLAGIRRDKALLYPLIERNARYKSSVARRDEFERGERRLLNFGHTLGHAIETRYMLSHGQAISIGMHYASLISERLTGFRDTPRVDAVLRKFGLPVDARFDVDKVLDTLRMDKKRVRKEMNYVLLERIGKGAVSPVPLRSLERWLRELQQS